MVASAVVAGVAAPIIIPAALGAAGFTAAGVGAGTLAAGIQAGIGNVVAGSLFAGLIFVIQSMIRSDTSLKNCFLISNLRMVLTQFFFNIGQLHTYA